MKQIVFYDEKGYIDRYSFYLTESQKKNNYKWRIAILIDFLAHIKINNSIGIGNGIGIYKNFSEFKSASFYNLIKKDVKLENPENFLGFYNFVTGRFIICDLEKVDDESFFKETLNTIIPGYTAKIN